MPPLFRWLQRAGGLDDAEMLRAFNMGVGLVLVCAPEHADRLLAALRASGERAWAIGVVGDGSVFHRSEREMGTGLACRPSRVSGVLT